MLVDTLFDLRLTRDMLDAHAAGDRPPPDRQRVNTHGNGDHWFGNELLPDGIPIVRQRGGAGGDAGGRRPRSSTRCSTSSTWAPSSTRSRSGLRRFDFAA